MTINELLFTHYDKIPFFKESRYLLQNMSESRSVEFKDETDFRQMLKSFKPIMVANTIPFYTTEPEIVIDVDFKLSKFDAMSLISTHAVVNHFVDRVNEMLNVKKVKCVFSGRGFHIKIRAKEIDEIINELKEKGVPRPTAEVFFVHAWSIVLDQLVTSDRRIIHKYAKQFGVPPDAFIDNIANRNRVIRSEYSINNKSFLPVVPFSPKRLPETISDITNAIIKTREYAVVLKEKIPVRKIDGSVEETTIATIDDYELLRLKLLYPEKIKTLKEL